MSHTDVEHSFSCSATSLDTEHPKMAALKWNTVQGCFAWLLGLHGCVCLSTPLTALVSIVYLQNQEMIVCRIAVHELHG